MNALVIDDEAMVRRFVVEVLRQEGWEVSEADSAEAAFEHLPENRWTLVFCDVMLGGKDGYAVLKRFGDEQPDAQVILMTGNGSAAGALDATAFGAYDYLVKPFSVNVVQALARSVQKRKSTRGSRGTKNPKTNSSGYTSDIVLIGSNPAFVESMKLIGRVAPTNLSVFITGESGTGKEIVARAIHLRSRRASKPFVAVNCGAIPAELIEAELFGHVRGSFTGAVSDRQGLFEEADGGTVFLDEITETTPAFQVKLLRALQEGEIRRVGSNQTIDVDVRVLAATNRDFESDMKKRGFRHDLLYRLNTVSINLPPLRDRREDVMALARHFAKLARSGGAPDLTFSPEVCRLLESYYWPGNIRELENAIVRAAALCDQTVRAEDLPDRIRQQPNASAEAARSQKEVVNDSGGESWLTLAEVESRYVTHVLAHTRGNRQAAARLLRVDRKTIDRMVKRHKIELPGRMGKSHHG